MNPLTQASENPTCARLAPRASSAPPPPFRASPPLFSSSSALLPVELWLGVARRTRASAVSVASETEAPRTAGWSSSSFRTRETQPAQCMPSTSSRTTSSRVVPGGAAGASPWPVEEGLGRGCLEPRQPLPPRGGLGVLPPRPPPSDRFTTL